MGLPFRNTVQTLEAYRDRGRSRLWIDRTELDALFAASHPAVADHRVAVAERRVLRADPPLTLLVADPARPPPSTTVLRFC